MILMESGQVYSWGFNDYGQLGLGSKMDRQVLRAWHGGVVTPRGTGDHHLKHAIKNTLTMYMMMFYSSACSLIFQTCFGFMPCSLSSCKLWSSI